MARLVPLLIMLASSIALAQPRPRPSAAKVPQRSVPCAPQDATLHATGGDAVVCWDKGCMKLDFSATDATWIVKPPAQPAWQTPRADVKDDQVCLGTTCKRFGKKLTAAVAEHKHNVDAVTLGGTTDLKAVIVGRDVWSVVGDSKLRFTTPKLYGRTGEKPGVASVDIAGNLLVVQWSACAGPCTKYQLADSAGRPKGPEGEGGGEVFQLDAKRFAVVGEYATISIFELGTGKARGVVKLGGGPDSNVTIRGDDTTIFSMLAKNDGVQIYKVYAYDDKTLEPSVNESMYLPSCKP